MSISKKIKLTIAIVLTGIVLILTFFSSTIYNSRLPMVVVGYVEKGAVVNTVNGIGAVELSEIESYFTAKVLLPPEAVNLFKENLKPDFFVNIPSNGQYGLDAELVTFRREAGELIAVVSFYSENLIGGEPVQLTMQASVVSNIVLPNTAIYKDENNNEYVLVVERHKISLGYEYILVKEPVSIVLSNEYYSAIFDFSDLFGEAYSAKLKTGVIVINSNRPVFHETRVRLADWGDFVGWR
ncbi:MAG: hypothetical protein FWE14_11505 [Lachnospiraceae bacterium]|nr:hypothetical protein [Lachnospiraceae bacterium]